MMKWTWPTTTVLITLGCSVSLGCSAGGSSGGTSVAPEQSMTPGTVRPGDTIPSITNPTSAGSTGGLIDDTQLEPSDECDGNIPVVFRDFSQAHPDFEMAFSGDGVRRQLISPMLGAGDKPVFLNSVGCAGLMNSPMACRTDWKVDKPVITSAATFDQWYRDVAGVNIPFPKELELTETSTGSGIYVFKSNDFFPLSPTDGFGITPPGQGKNFLFTTEIHLNFEYIAKQSFTFRGDDDLWIFINKRLALDLGSMHSEQEGTIDFDARATELGIGPGHVYSMDIFHAERHTSASNFSIETNIACFTPAIVY
jgi:fibro-slime domain-containing protein